MKGEADVINHQSLTSQRRMNMTLAKNLLTRVSSLSFHLGPPKVFFTLYNTKEVPKVIRYKFSENNIQDTIRNPYVPQKEISNISPIPRNLLNGQFLQVGLRITVLQLFLRYLQISPVAHQFFYMIYHVNHVFVFISR